MKPFFILAVFLQATVAIAQNIVPNPGFETYTICPGNYNNARGPLCTGWTSGSGSSPDYFNVCSTETMGVPSNAAGYKTAFDGVGYVGIQALNTFDVWDYEDVEYVMASLPPLQKDTQYVAVINVALAGQLSNYAIAGLGVYFNTFGSPDTVTLKNLEVVPQVDYTHYGIISDTLHWTRLVDTFTADSAYKYMFIGNFKDKYHTDTLRVPGGPNPQWHVSYYYIDHVSVQKLSTYHPVEVAQVSPSLPVAVYPNPLTTSASLTFSYDGDPCTLDIYNVQGQRVRHIAGITQGNVSIERGNLLQGCYFYHLYNDRETLSRGKLVMSDQ